MANPGPAAADLPGWFLSDDPADPFKFQIPAGFNIPGEGYLRVWADDEILQNDLSVRPDLHVPFKLGVDGESILLSAPDGSLIDRVDFGRQSPDKTMGLSEGGIAALASPSPGAANGRVAVDPSATYSIDGNLITFSVIAEPGFLYEVEVSGNLENWEVLGSPVLADSTTLPFIEVLSETRRFYRFRRLP